jgi:serine protease SohB
MHYLADYSLFLAKAITVVIALLAITGGVLALVFKSKSHAKSHMDIKKINEKYEGMEETLQAEILSKKAFKVYMKEKRKNEKNKDKERDKDKDKTAEEPKKNLYVLNFNGDIRASAGDQLREEITAILSVATPKDEVVVCLESGGGVVHGYGLCASQLKRLKAQNISLTIIIDKIAASGGYLMACVGDKILAAPFAIIGSIGVIAQLPNFHRWLQKREIDFEQITAGEYKRTLTLLGENTDKARDKMKQDIEEIHHYFKVFITENRPQVNIAEVATGEHWLASKALELKLVDGLDTSDDYLFSHYKTADIFEISYIRKKTLSEKFSQFIEEKSGLFSAFKNTGIFMK